MNHHRIGRVELTRVLELCQPAVGLELLPDLPADAIERHRSWLEPTFYDAVLGKLIMSTHGWLLRTPRCNVLVEACGGNHKQRKDYPRFHRLETPWLDHLQHAGCAPEQIDFVMCSHLHADHVGWNTSLKDGRWVPTFPRAKYLIGRREFDNWNPRTRTLPPMPLNVGVFEDSVLPVVEAGQAEFVDAGYSVDDVLTVEASPGHTLGHVSIRVEDGGASGIFSGDIMHSPLQIIYPQCNTWSCEDQTAARNTRLKLLEDCAEHRRLLMPAHFPHPYSVLHVERETGGFGFRAAR